MTTPKELDYYWSKRLLEHGPTTGILNIACSEQINKEIARIEEELVNYTIKGIEPKSALDAGCGVGRYCQILSKKGWQITAVDISREMIKETSKRTKNIAKIKLIHGDIQHLVFKKPFELIMSISVIMHLPPKSRRQYLTRINNASKKGTQLVILANENNLYRRLQKQCIGPTKKRIEKGYWLEILPKREIEQFMKRKGWQLKVKKGIGVTSLALLVYRIYKKRFGELSCFSKLIKVSGKLDTILRFRLHNSSSKVIWVFEKC